MYKLISHVVTGVVEQIPYTATEQADYDIKKAAADAALPAQIKASQWQAIKAKRDTLGSTGGYKVGAKWFHSTVESRIQHLGLIALGANIPANLDWKTMDGSFIRMTPALAGQVFAAAVTQDLALFAAGEAHRAAMEAAADPSAYDISQGWPAVYVS